MYVSERDGANMVARIFRGPSSRQKPYGAYWCAPARQSVGSVAEVWCLHCARTNTVKAACCAHSGRLQAAKGPEKEKVQQEVTPSMRANLIRIIGRYHSHVLPARGGADAPTTAGTASTAAASTDAAAD